MYPKTLYGWYNKLVRGYPYNEKTAHILDHTSTPSSRLVSTLVSRNGSVKTSDSKNKGRLFRS